jgi:integrase
MSVYRPANRPHYLYDFQLQGARFSGSTGAASERDAKRIEKERRAEAKKELALTAAAKGAPWTFGRAATVYFEEVLRGSLNPSTKCIMVWLQTEVGMGTRLVDINTAFVKRLTLQRARDAGKKPGSVVTNATINRTVTEPLRRIMRHAATVHEQPVGKVEWRQVLLKEASERIRELKDAEEDRLFATLRCDYHPIVRFCLLTGLRLAEACGLRWSDVDFGNRHFQITGKGGKLASVPLSPSAREVIWPLQGRHPERVFTYACRRSGEMCPITYEGLKVTFRRTIRRAGISDFRFHDLRHTAGTRILRATGNLRSVQAILRHEDIATTTRYAHVQQADLLEAMEAAATRSVTASPIESPIRGEIA